ncbi:hypothetical protein ACFO4O_00740 [Glaciecola siphonariae]|uniref:DUF2490 domain-containing protein n=1 Tax=Glaciecola siphonariae TaxID=521012 RepID=A0ABV9LQY9_9ALTE
MLRDFSRIISVLFLACISYSQHSHASISGVMGPDIDPTDRSIQFRIADSFGDDEAQSDKLAYRLHYQYAFNDTFRGRVLVQYREKNNFEYDFFRAEMLYNFKKRKAGEIFSSALRFDFRTRRGSRAEEIAVNWGSQWLLSNGYRFRTTLILGQQVGANRQSNDLSVQTRASVGKKLENGLRVELQMLNQHGELGNFGSLGEQGFLLGPSVSGKLGRFQYEFRYLNALTSTQKDHNFFFRVTTRL